jgi:isoquinoline 1-oxidoreductase beta subunit
MRRRTFLLAGLGAAGTLFVGWSLTPPRQRLYPTDLPEPGDGAVPLNGWVAVAPDGQVTVMAPKAEMGQGIHTALAMLVAEELDCDWSRVRVVHGGVDKIYNNIAVIVDGLPVPDELAGNAAVRAVRWLTAKSMREVGVMMTGGSSSVRDVWEVARLAGATARTSLVAAAAARAKVDPSQCRTEAGVVFAGAQQYPYGALVRDAAAQRVDAVTLREPAQFRLIGRDHARVDIHATATGAPRYGIDVRGEGMLYAAVRMAPVFGTQVQRYDKSAVLTRPGVRAVVELLGSRWGDVAGVAVVAENWWQARQAIDTLDVEFTAGEHASLDSAAIARQLRESAMGDDGLPFRSYGDALDVVSASTRTLDALYEAPYLAHATMEPMNATVRVRKDGADVYTGTQVAGAARAAVADVLGLDEEQVTLHQMALGGGFGRRLEVDYVAQAAAIAASMPGTMIQTIWSREDDLQHDFYRPAAATRLRASLDANGTVTSLVTQSASQAPFKALSKRLRIPFAAFSPDKTTAEGLFDQPYEWPALRSAHEEISLPVPVGSWRSVGHSHQAFFLESFVDELAHAATVDPLQFRLRLLTRHPRARAVLEAVARESGWGTPLAPTADGRPRARGMALHASFSSIAALVAEVSLAADGRVQVHHTTVAVDCGLVVNPNGVRQQVEGSVVYGLSAALYGEVPIAGGRPQVHNFNDSPPLRMSECPSVTTIIIPSTSMPSGIGEPVVPVVAPAVGNAIFALTGTRVRALPFRALSPSSTTASAMGPA